MKRFLLFSLIAVFSLTVNAQTIRLLAFNVTKISSSQSVINWQTADFSSSDEKFEIQRAGSDNNFVTIGMVTGNETSHLYIYNDNRAMVGVNYYRLRMTDKDADVIYSKAVAIMNKANGLLITSLFPNIITSTATLSVTSRTRQPLGITITDMQGRVFLRRNFPIAAGNTNIEFSFAGLAAGTHSLTATSAEGITQTIRFIKQ